MRYYPIHLDLQERPVLVVGGGVIAEGKAEQLIAARAQVRVVSPTLTARLAEWQAQGLLTWREGKFDESDLADVALVISATDDQAVNETVARAAAARGLLCNVVDQPALCSFITPALVTRGELQISISTGGSSPTIAQLVKQRIAETIGEEYGELLQLTAQLRVGLRARGIGYGERRDLLNAFVESEVLALLHAGRVAEAEQLAQAVLASVADRAAAHNG
jgi:siroheme synthase-like protein